jgi:hypothetical protein
VTAQVPPIGSQAKVKPKKGLLFVPKKKQKNFLTLRPLAWARGGPSQRQGMDKKFFWFFLFTKRTACLPTLDRLEIFLKTHLGSYLFFKKEALAFVLPTPP